MPHISLEYLEPHPDNANRMSRAIFSKLAAHIRVSGDYPAIIVRPLGNSGAPERFQILDGHHRLQVLRQLGYEHAKCDIWHVDDERAAMLLATLNRLHGEDDPARLGALLEKITKSMNIDELARLVPDDAARIRKLIDAAHRPQALIAPPDVDGMPQAVTFFVTEPQRCRLFQRLAAIDSDRSAALVKLLSLDDEGQCERGCNATVESTV